MAKLNVVIPAVEVTVGGATYRKVERAAVAGDIVKMVATSAEWSVTIGGFYEVIDVDYAGDAQITDDDGDGFDTVGDTLEVYEKVTEAAAVDPRRLTVGDYAKVVTIYGGHNYMLGSVVKIAVDDESGIPYQAEKTDGSVGNWLSSRNVETATEAEFLAQKKPAAKIEYREVKRKANVGERIRIVSTWLAGSYYKIGDEFMAAEVNYKGGVTVTLPDGATPYISYQHEEYVVLEPIEVAAAKRALDPRSQFAVGDKVRLVSGGRDFPLFGFDNGKVYEVTDPTAENNGGDRVKIKQTGGAGYALPSQLVKVTAEEIAEAAKWTAIGRKVGELKAGDIVEVTGEGAAGLRIGHIDKVSSVDSDGDVYFEGTSNKYGAPTSFYLRRNIKLVTPVEQRFDSSL